MARFPDYNTNDTSTDPDAYMRSDLPITPSTLPAAAAPVTAPAPLTSLKASPIINGGIDPDGYMYRDGAGRPV